ncbi:transcriptional regulator [Streptomyces sp. HNM0575]|uniref:ScbA/BarX family gamma-butyrolactone biosynthesis protein n=1 Tax=Streptomyces sp. HNM0575 TaxID=2716338 RepID=UPI00145F9892|nr:ScbA/BarX family gamma-butyrolactone biosynthesis protein [Streptomyces sp. HNM0575]NLU76633.1 transcriptional regulator [Streptomyces sp. HNM0575]
MAFTPDVPQLPENTAYSWPVPRELVHKTAHTEVLLTGWRQSGEREFEVGAQWPRDHGFWRTDDGGVQDPMLLVETTRQALPLFAHAAFGVPAGHQLIWDHQHCVFSVPFLAVSGSPAEVTLRLSASRPPEHGARKRQIALTMSVHCGERTLGTVSTVYSAHSPAVYRRLRGPGTPAPPEAMAAALVPPRPLAPALVGRESEREVVLAAADDGDGDGDGTAVAGRAGRVVNGRGGEGSWPRRQLRVLTSSPWLFDHPVDHAPGMLLMEAARQVSHLAAAPHRPRLTRMDADFHRYVDLDEPGWVDVSPGPVAPAAGAPQPSGERTVTVEITQHGEKAFSAVVGFVTEETPDAAGPAGRKGDTAPAAVPPGLG